MVPTAPADVPRRFTWICRDQRELERWLDMDARLDRLGLVSLVAMALLLLPAVPTMKPAAALPLLPAGAIYHALRWSRTRLRRPEVAAAIGLALIQALLAIAVVINGDQHVGGLLLLLWPIAGAVGGFPRRVLYAGATLTGALMLVASLGFDGGVALADPIRLCLPLGLLAAVTIMFTGLHASDLAHRDAAIVDQLTGLLNRTALASRSAELGQRSGLTGERVAMVLGDIDSFKAVNDTHGHAVGDVVLREVAYRLREHVRGIDVAYRIGGEEFVVLVAGADEMEAATLAERLRAAIADRPVAGLSITMSFGVATSSDGEPYDFERTFARADRALYAAKQAGRNRVCATPAGGGYAVGARVADAAPPSPPSAAGVSPKASAISS